MTISLNALRVFLIAAQDQSLKQAAGRLNLSPGAVSHQVRQLENSLGVPLFERRNNAVTLTASGRALAAQAQPGLDVMQAALENVTRAAHEITVNVSASFATRWLIPRLEQFRARHPRARIRLETVKGNGPVPAPASDLTITYVRADALPPDGTVLFEDRCRPYLSPALLARLDDPQDLARIPALECAEGNWDWAQWLRSTGRTGMPLTLTDAFDLDDAALRAAVAGMGMTLASQFMIADDLQAGQLVPVPGTRDALLGYFIVIRGPRQSGLTEQFMRWMQRRAEASGSGVPLGGPALPPG